jgi:glycosyltransferase involved in cell wall biosynthesis
MVGNKKRIVVFIDWVLAKNKVQIDAAHRLGYSLSFFVGKYNESSSAYFLPDDEHILLKAGFFSRLQMIGSYLKENRANLHHLEVYPGGRFSFVYVLLSLYFGVPCICVERGDLLYFKKGGYGTFTRISMWICYKFSDIVWYREPYMLELLEKMKVRNAFFLHNAIEMTNRQAYNNGGEFYKEIDYLWVNRIITQRRSDWFATVLACHNFKDSRNVIAGILDNSAYRELQESLLKSAPSNLTILSFISNPSELYKKARFFVLPAEVVFANNALLEAMSYGAVPLISRQSGSELIVEDGVSGFLFDHNQESFKEAMLKAFKLSNEAYLKMSFAAIDQIKMRFSSDTYYIQLQIMYNKLSN